MKSSGGADSVFRHKGTLDDPYPGGTRKWQVSFASSDLDAIEYLRQRHGLVRDIEAVRLSLRLQAGRAASGKAAKLADELRPGCFTRRSRGGVLVHDNPEHRARIAAEVRRAEGDRRRILASRFFKGGSVTESLFLTTRPPTYSSIAELVGVTKQRAHQVVREFIVELFGEEAGVEVTEPSHPIKWCCWMRAEDFDAIDAVQKCYKLPHGVEAVRLALRVQATLDGFEPYGEAW